MMRDQFVFDETAVQEYLAFGYVPSEAKESSLEILGEWSRLPRRSVEDVTESALVDEGRLALTAAIDVCAEAASLGDDHVVFLSGGLDSRAILGAVLDRFESSEVVAATFGMPGEMDFDFAAAVAAKVGVRHERLESSSMSWSTEGLVESVLARRVKRPGIGDCLFS